MLHSKKPLYWLPRLIAVVYVIFLEAMTLDAVGGSQWWWGWLGHSLPALLVFLATVVAWRRAQWGGWLFLAVSIGMGLFTHWQAWPLLGAPPLLVSALYFGLNYWHHRSS